MGLTELSEAGTRCPIDLWTICQTMGFWLYFVTARLNMKSVAHLRCDMLVEKVVSGIKTTAAPAFVRWKTND